MNRLSRLRAPSDHPIYWKGLGRNLPFGTAVRNYLISIKVSRQNRVDRLHDLHDPHPFFSPSLDPPSFALPTVLLLPLVPCILSSLGSHVPVVASPCSRGPFRRDCNPLGCSQWASREMMTVIDTERVDFPVPLSHSIVLSPLEQEGHHFILSYCLLALSLISAEVFVVDSSVFVQLVFSRISHIRPHRRRQVWKGHSILSLILIHLVSCLSPPVFFPGPWASVLALVALWALDLGMSWYLVSMRGSGFCD